MAHPDNIIPLHRSTAPDSHKGYPRYVRPIPHEHKARAMGDPDALFRRFDAPPVITDLGHEPSVTDDLRDLWTDIAADPSSHIVAAFLGLVVGCFGTVGLAYALVAF